MKNDCVGAGLASAQVGDRKDGQPQGLPLHIDPSPH